MSESDTKALHPIENVQLGERTYEQLRAAIVAVELRPGEVLKDRELAARLAVSRTPVREALYRLEAVGLVESRGRSGWAVASFTERDVHDLFEMRRLLEPVGLDRLAKQFDPDAVARLGRAFDGFENRIAPELLPDYFGADHAFHKLLIECSGNERLQGFYAIVEDHIDRGRHLLLTEVADRVDATLDEHLSIVEAIVAGDFDRAKVELLSHLHTGEAMMTNQLRNLMERHE